MDSHPKVALDVETDATPTRLSGKNRAGLPNWSEMGLEHQEMRLVWSFYGGWWVEME